MINYLSSTLMTSVYNFTVSDLLAGTKSYVWNGGLIVFVAYYNYTQDDFTSIQLSDAAGNNLVHTVATHQNCYSIAFSGNGAGNPLETNTITNMNSIRFDFNIANPISGSLMAKVYYI